MKCTYILPYFHSYHNFKILKEVINTIITDTDINILLIEVGKESHIQSYDLLSRKIFLKSDTWNLAWIYNVAMKYVKTEYVIFSELEIIPNMSIIKSVIDKFESNGMTGVVKLQKNGIQLDRTESITMKFDPTTKPKIDIMGGYSFYLTDDVNKVFSWDENLIGNDIHKYQDHKNSKILNMSKSDSFVYILEVDHMDISDIDIKKSDMHLSQIESLDDIKMKNYLLGYHKKSGIGDKYNKVDVYDVQ